MCPLTRSNSSDPRTFGGHVEGEEGRSPTGWRNWCRPARIPRKTWPPPRPTICRPRSKARKTNTRPRRTSRTPKRTLATLGTAACTRRASIRSCCPRRRRARPLSWRRCPRPASAWPSPARPAWPGSTPFPTSIHGPGRQPGADALQGPPHAARLLQAHRSAGAPQAGHVRRDRPGHGDPRKTLMIPADGVLHVGRRDYVHRGRRRAGRLEDHRGQDGRAIRQPHRGSPGPEGRATASSAPAPFC